MRGKSTMALGLVCLLSLALTGCKYEREEEDALGYRPIYDDVGEMDLQRRVYARMPKHHAEQAAPQHDQYASKHRNEIGEMSLDMGPLPAKREAKRDERKEERKTVDEVSQRNRAARPVSWSVPSQPAPAPRAEVVPVRRVTLAAPPPPPAPEYRVKETAHMATRKLHHGDQVGEMMLGY